MIRLITLISIIIQTLLANAQVEIVTDRPDQTEASSTIPKQSIQIETGILWERTKTMELELDHYAIPNTLIRYGINQWLEARLVIQPDIATARIRESSETNRGFSDPQLGFKVQILRDPGINTEIAFLSHISAPLGSEDFGNDKSTSISKLSISHSLSETISIGYNLGFDYFNSYSYAGTYSLALGFAIGEKTGFYIETYGGYEQFEDFNLLVDGGFTYLPQANVQLDISGAIDTDVDYHYLNLGISWLFQKTEKTN